MNDEQLMQDAYDALCVAFPGRQGFDEWEQNGTLRAALLERLAQPISSEQEPVATVIKNGASREWMSERLGKFADGIYSLYARPAPAQQPLASGQEPDMLAICAALGFDPTNHHNAAKCPYCRPAAPAEQPLSAAYEKGWREAAKWASRYDLVSDIGSPSYLEKMAAHGIKEKP
jgi:hypothetical protein